MGHPMNDPQKCTLGELLAYIKRSGEAKGSAGAMLRFVLTDEEGNPEAICIAATGRQAVRWSLICAGVVEGEEATSSAVGIAAPPVPQGQA